MSDVLRFDLAKDPKGNPITYGRVGDSDGLTRRVKVFEDGKPLDLTGWATTFEGNTSNWKTKVFDTEGINIIDATKGEFSYTFPNMAFAVEGQYERAYFSFMKGDQRKSTGNFEIIVLGDSDIDAPEAETIITEYNKLVAELNELQNQAIDEMNRNFSEAQGRISELEVQINDLRNKIDQALTDFENGNFWTKEESFNKEESSANVIYQVIGKDEVEMTLTFDLKNKIASSDVENPNSASFGAGPTLYNPNQFTADAYINYLSLYSLDGTLLKASNRTQGNIAQVCIIVNILEELQRFLGQQFFIDRGAVTEEQKVAVLEMIVTEFTSNIYGFGAGTSGNLLTQKNWYGAWTEGETTTANTVTRIGRKLTNSDNNWSKYINGGKIPILITTGESDGITSSSINLDYANVEVKLKLSANEHIKLMIAANHRENLATQEEAELGEDNTKTMTPLRTDQYFKAHLATQEEAENGVSHLKTMTPKRTAEQTLARFGQSFTPSTKFIAHRGNNYFYPENSIAAFEKTSRHWGAETDIQLTTDGKWYCFHDRTLDRMTNGTGNFMDKTSSEIEALRLDTGNGINTLSDVEKKIPTFEQYLNACIKARIVPVIEITPLKTDFTDAQLDSIVTVIRRKGLLNKCVIICFTYEVLVKMRQRMPYTVMHWLISEYSEEMIQKCVINNFVPSFDYSKASVNQALIDKIHDAGLECGLWTVPYSDHQKYTDMGVDNITTDSASGNLRYFEPALRSGMLPNSVDLSGPTYIEETSNGEIHIRVNVTGGQNDVGVYICALESWAIPRHSLTLIGYVRSTKVTGFTFVPVSVGVGGYSANDSSIADANIKFGYLTTGTNWEQRATYAAFDLFYRI